MHKYFQCRWNVFRHEKWASAWDLQQCGMCDQQSLKSDCAYFASHLNIVWVLIYWLNIILSFQVKRRLQRLVQVYTRSLVKCQIMPRLKFNDNFYSLRHHFSWKTYARKWVVILKVTEARLGELWKMYLFSTVYHSSAAHIYCSFLLFPHFLYKKRFRDIVIASIHLSHKLLDLIEWLDDTRQACKSTFILLPPTTQGPSRGVISECGFAMAWHRPCDS